MKEHEMWMERGGHFPKRDGKIGDVEVPGVRDLAGNSFILNGLEQLSWFGTRRVSEEDNEAKGSEAGDQGRGTRDEGQGKRDKGRGDRKVTTMQVTGSDGAAVREGSRAEAVVGESLAGLTREGETWGELAHDARNLMTALSLYCDLLEEPGVLAQAHRHYGCELRLVAEASRRLVEKLALFRVESVRGEASEPGVSPVQGRLFSNEGPEPGVGGADLRLERRMRGAEPARIPVPAEMVEDLREELLASREILAALAGPSIRVTVVAQGGARGVRLTGEDLLRVLVNLVRNASESMAGAGAIVIHLEECREGAEGRCRRLLLTVEDSGPGIAAGNLEKVFERGFTTRAGHGTGDKWAGGHRGLGLAITRSLVEIAGGRIYAENSPRGGARLVIEMPVRPESSGLGAGSVVSGRSLPRSTDR